MDKLHGINWCTTPHDGFSVRNTDYNNTYVLSWRTNSGFATRSIGPEHTGKEIAAMLRTLADIIENNPVKD